MMQNNTFNKTQSSMSESFFSNLSSMSSRSASFVSNISNMSIRNLRIRQHLRSRLRRIKRIGKLQMLERKSSLLGLSTSQCQQCNILFFQNFVKGHQTKCGVLFYFLFLFIQNFVIGHQTKCGVYSCAAYEEFSFNIPDHQISKKSEDCTYCRSCQFCFSTDEV